MSGRLERRFAALKAEDRAGFIAYVMAGDPDPETSLAILRGLPTAGADVIELGLPFSDPMADGPSIQRAAQRALKQAVDLDAVLRLARRFRDTDSETPLVLMGYLNPLLTPGLPAFAERAAEAGIDGLIVVDCPPEEAEPLADALDAVGIDLVRLATPTTDAERLKIVSRRSSGFLYYVSVAGVTGAKSAEASAIAPAVAQARAASGLPVAVGFGIRTPAQAAAVARIADAAVVGSALVDVIESETMAGRDPTTAVLAAAAELARAVHEARLAEHV